MKKCVYVAGPYTHGNVLSNVRAAIEAADQLARAGFYPYVPHLSHFWHSIFPHAYNFWMDQGVAWLTKCDCLVRLPGESPGADAEVAVAERHGIKVYFSVLSCINSEKVDLELI